MLRRLLGLFAQYRAVHLETSRPGFALIDDSGSQIGNIDLVQLRGAHLRVQGWALAGRVTLRGGSFRATGRPDLPRTDVANSRGIDPDLGFDLQIPRPPAERHRLPYLVLEAPGRSPSAEPEVFALPLPVTRGLRLLPGFLRRLTRAAPAMIRWRLSRNPSDRAMVRRHLGFLAQAQGARLLPEALRVPTTIAPPVKVPITIVLPVYNAFDLLQEALDRVLRHTDLPWHLVVIEDCSTDPQVRPWLRTWAAEQGTDQVTLIENETNLGFIGGVNRGFEAARARGDHVVLLNSDALVPEGWASRLLRPIVADGDVATVTPMSNDAEIFSAPLLCKRTVLQPGMADAIDRVATRLNAGAVLAEAPTGVGFCMAMNARFLARVPTLDPVFGKGYGEEVDWCQRVRRIGGRHLGTGALFVEHRGGESFGSETKRALVAANGKTISRRYPAYDAEVQSFIATDPLLTPRLALALGWAGAWAEAEDRAVPVYIAHTLGGGAENYLERRIETDLGTGCPSVVIRLGGPARWQIEVIAPEGKLTGHTDETTLMLELLAGLSAKRIVYSCAVGDSDPITLPDILLDMAAGAPIEILFHDYFPLSPAYTLLDSEARYHGVAAATRDLNAPLTRPDRSPISLQEWQAAWGRLAEAAEELVTFSDDSAAHVAAAYPEAAGRIVVRPHALLTPVPAIFPERSAPRVVAVLGNIGLQKGLEVLSPLAAALSPDAKLMVLGKVDLAYPLSDKVAVHGAYRVEDLPALVARYGITDWLIPSIWPETFSYTTHEALATGMPVFAFAIGAQGDTVAKARNGIAVPFTTDGPDALAATLATAIRATAPAAVASVDTPVQA